MDYQNIIDRYYPKGSTMRDIYMRHAIQVTQKALDIIDKCKLDINADEVKAAAMLHDIGICLTYAPDIGCNGSEPYIAHGILGAELLRKEGMDEIYARVAERHTGAGITIAEIDEQSLPLPRRDYTPETLLERLVCYADKFYSKSGDMKEKDIATIRRSMARHSDISLKRWLSLESEFSCSDVRH